MEIAALHPADWELLKDIRLRALADSPKAFASSHAHEEVLGEAAWRNSFTDAVWVVARHGGAEVGLARSVKVPDRPQSERHVESVWVDGLHRLHGITRRIFEKLAEIERKSGVVDLRVWVIEENWPAPLVYNRLGFIFTGERKQLDDGSGRWEKRLSLTIAP